jgi:hypothetical protein
MIGELERGSPAERAVILQYAMMAIFPLTSNGVKKKQRESGC